MSAATLVLAFLFLLWRANWDPGGGSIAAGHDLAHPSRVGLLEALKRDTDLRVDASTTPLVTGTRPLHLGLVLHSYQDQMRSPASAVWHLRYTPKGDDESAASEWRLTGGAGAIHVASGGRIEVLGVTLGSLRAVPRRQVVVIGDESELQLEADLPEGRFVHVVSEATGEDLDEVLLLPVTQVEQDTPLPPTRALDANRAGFVASPFVLSDVPSAGEFWIGAPGFAWRRIRRARQAGVQLCALPEGGDLMVKVVPQPADVSHVRLQVRACDGTWSSSKDIVYEALGSRREVRIPGLPPGEVVIRALAELGEAGVASLAETRVRVEPDAIVEAVLDLQGHSTRDGFADAIVLVDLENPLDAIATEIVLSDPDTDRVVARRLVYGMAAGLDARWGWQLKGFPVGRWRARAEPGQVWCDIEVATGAVGSGRLRVPALELFRLWIMDGETGESIVPDAVSWVPLGGAGTSRRRLRPDAAPVGALELPMADGEYSVSVRAAGFASATRTIEVSPSTRDGVLVLERSDERRLLVRLVHEGAWVAATEETWTGTTLEDAAGNSALMRVQIGDGAECPSGACATLTVKNSGTYELVLGSVPGFSPAEPTRVVVGDGSSQIDLELVPLWVP